MGIGFQFSSFLAERKKGCPIHGGGGKHGHPSIPSHAPVTFDSVLNLGDIIV